MLEAFRSQRLQDRYLKPLVALTRVIATDLSEHADSSLMAGCWE
jgi:hypothetical protein